VGFPVDGCGEVFKVDANGNFSVFYSFAGDNSCWHGCYPLAPLTLDPAGNFYGTTYLGGSRNCNPGRMNNQEGFGYSDCGLVFKLDTTGKETVLHRFGKARQNGDFPNPGLILDAAGNLYGTTLGGGINGNGGDGGAGTLFKMDPAGNETVLHFFLVFVDGWQPVPGLIRDAAGDFYGVTYRGGPCGLGSVFKMDSQDNVTVLLDFCAPGDDGESPLAGVIMDGAGNLYGTAVGGGNFEACNGTGCGAVYKLDQLGNETALYNFGGGNDGAYPEAGLVMDTAGNLYGTTAYGGTINSACPAGCGVVFKITP
jgi:uncharacterized repeat protein (TIGR03803 family)